MDPSAHFINSIHLYANMCAFIKAVFTVKQAEKFSPQPAGRPGFGMKPGPSPAGH